MQLDNVAIVYVYLQLLLLGPQFLEQVLKLLFVSSQSCVQLRLDFVVGLDLVVKQCLPELFSLQLVVESCDSGALALDVVLLFTFVDDDVLVKQLLELGSPLLQLLPSLLLLCDAAVLHIKLGLFFLRKAQERLFNFLFDFLLSH